MTDESVLEINHEKWDDGDWRVKQNEKNNEWGEKTPDDMLVGTKSGEGTFNTQIEQELQGVEGYSGTFCYDEAPLSELFGPKSSGKLVTTVVNTGSSAEGGEHWCVLFRVRGDQIGCVSVFCPLGSVSLDALQTETPLGYMSAPMIAAINDAGLSVVRASGRYQLITGDSCGKMCLALCHFMPRYSGGPTANPFEEFAECAGQEPTNEGKGAKRNEIALSEWIANLRRDKKDNSSN
jgi:hypothetical protein